MRLFDGDKVAALAALLVRDLLADLPQVSEGEGGGVECGMADPPALPPRGGEGPTCVWRAVRDPLAAFLPPLGFPTYAHATPHVSTCLASPCRVLQDRSLGLSDGGRGCLRP